jgi:RsiW-degrading membrane proteinase PrsW (M82 family)
VDPVKSRFAGEYDLYDLATWEARSGLDRFAVSVADSLRTIRSRLLITTALVLFLGQIALAGVLVIDQPVLGVLAALSVVPALFVALTLWYWDPTTREPVELIAITFLLSMLFASFAATVNTLVRPGFTVFGGAGVILFYFLVVGPIEEMVKWLAIRVRAYNSDAFRTVLDGVVYGAIAGLGFAAIENFIYVVGASVESAQVGGAGGVGSATLTAAARAFVGPGHVVFSAWAGFYLGLAKFNPDNWAPIVVKGLLIAAFIHALYNSLVGVVPAVLAAVGIPPGLAFIGFVLGYQSFWFGLLYRKVLAYRAYYESISPAKLTSGT